MIPSFRVKLGPMTRFLDDASVTELAVNAPGGIWLTRYGQANMVYEAVPELDYRLLETLAYLTASYTGQTISERTPLLSGIIPVDLKEGVADTERGGYRIQFVLPPATETGKIAMSIRKPGLRLMTTEDYLAQDAFRHVNKAINEETLADTQLQTYYDEENWDQFLIAAVKAKKNIVLSAATDSGKTTALNWLASHIPVNERIVVIEDTREVLLAHRNVVYLLYSRGGQGLASNAGPNELLESTLRLAPKRIIKGELRGAEVIAFLDAINTGHPGNITTIHANSPTQMFERIGFLALKARLGLSKAEVIDYARSVIDVVVQLKHASAGERYFSDIYYAGKR
ncbi:MAG: P-type DNA transfer ATPase VirB11 [Ottowia sp.]|nr:P-type DNA transfer ATPase VirB11 [Ottowia sp.]